MVTGNNTQVGRYDTKRYGEGKGKVSIPPQLTVAQENFRGFFTFLDKRKLQKFFKQNKTKFYYGSTLEILPVREDWNSWSALEMPICQLV